MGYELVKKYYKGKEVLPGTHANHFGKYVFEHGYDCIEIIGKQHDEEIEKLQAENKKLSELCVDLWNGFEGLSEIEDERMNDRVEQCLKEIEK